MTDDTASFELPKNVKIEDCEMLHSFLTAAQNKHITIDCHAVDRMSGLCAQMLLMAATGWRAQARRVTFTSPSDGFYKSVELLGMRELLLTDEVPA